MWVNARVCVCVWECVLVKCATSVARAQIAKQEAQVCLQLTTPEEFEILPPPPPHHVLLEQPLYYACRNRTPAQWGQSLWLCRIQARTKTGCLCLSLSPVQVSGASPCSPSLFSLSFYHSLSVCASLSNGRFYLSSTCAHIVR